MSESDFYSRRVRPGLGKLCALSRVENRVEPGTPDLSYSSGNRHGWVELKIVRHDALHFERSQIPWMTARLRHSRRGLWVLASDDKFTVLRLISANRVVAAPRRVKTMRGKVYTVVDLADLKPELCLGRPWNWVRVLEALVLG